ncbi:4-alpha-glucanotransferase, partial [Streptomyces adustus]|nr:4-alpha-glucanotransferase [Streptomyces adustus]
MTGPGTAAPLTEDLSRLAALHGVATSYSPSPDRTVEASATAVVSALAALGVDAGTPQAARAALAVRERELRARLLPPTVVCRTGTAPRALDALPEGTRLRVDTEQGGTRTIGPGEPRTAVGDLPPGVHRLTATTPEGRTAQAHLV